MKYFNIVSAFFIFTVQFHSNIVGTTTFLKNKFLYFLIFFLAFFFVSILFHKIIHRNFKLRCSQNIFLGWKNEKEQEEGFTLFLSFWAGILPNLLKKMLCYFGKSKKIGRKKSKQINSAIVPRLAAAECDDWKLGVSAKF